MRCCHLRVAFNVAFTFPTIVVEPSLQAVRAETMVDGLPRACRWLGETVYADTDRLSQAPWLVETAFTP